jgi:hypothetical protein
VPRRSILGGREHGGTLGCVGEPIHHDPTIKKRTPKVIKNHHAHLPIAAGPPPRIEVGPDRRLSGAPVPEVGLGGGPGRGNLSFTKCGLRHTTLAVAAAFRRPDLLQAPATQGRHD